MLPAQMSNFVSAPLSHPCDLRRITVGELSLERIQVVPVRHHGQVLLLVWAFQNEQIILEST